VLEGGGLGVPLGCPAHRKRKRIPVRPQTLCAVLGPLESREFLRGEAGKRCSSSREGDEKGSEGV
jgi:hypothetical protein